MDTNRPSNVRGTRFKRPGDRVVITLYATAAERTMIAVEAEKNGLSVSAYCVRKLTRKRM